MKKKLDHISKRLHPKMNELKDTQSNLNISGIPQGIQSTDSFTTVNGETFEVWDSGFSSWDLSYDSDREQRLGNIISSINKKIRMDVFKGLSKMLQLQKSLAEKSFPDNVSKNEYSKQRYFEQCATIAFYQYLQQILKARMEIENGSYNLFDTKNVGSFYKSRITLRGEHSFESKQSSCFGNFFRMFKK